VSELFVALLMQLFVKIDMLRGWCDMPHNFRHKKSVKHIRCIL